jgi:hypothetical protein
MNELTVNSNGNVSLDISESFMSLLNDIKADGRTNYISLTEDGVKVGDDYFSEVFAKIVDLDKYSYRWENGKNKIIKRGMDKAEAKNQGFADGMDLTLQMIKPEFDDLFTMSLPQSSYWNFAKYVQHLLAKGVTPKHVITKIRPTMRQFKAGKPVAVANFEAVAMVQQDQAVNVTPAPAAPVQANDIPAEWSV